MLVFITGGSGFVGSRLIKQLVSNGHTVRALVRSNGSAALVESLGADSIKGDLLNEAALIKGIRGCDVVFHVAGHQKTWDHYKAFYQTNVEGTRSVLRASEAAGAKCLVQVGAAAVVMGRPRPILQATEDMPLKMPRFAPYIATKALAEHLVLEANSPSLRTVVVRPPFIWGPNLPMIPSVAESIKKGQFRWIEQGRYPCSTCHVENVCYGMLLAAEHGRGGEAYFLSDGEDLDLREFLTALLKAYGISPGNQSIPFRLAWTVASIMEFVWRVGQIQSEILLTRQSLRMIGKPFTVSIDKAKRELGYMPRVLHRDGIQMLAGAAL